jgi:hypothetical protein
MRTGLSFLLAMALSGCHFAADADGYRWTLKAPSKVEGAPHGRLFFTVETTTPRGTAIGGVPYIWIVDWVGLHGVEHQGDSYREENIRVKGGAGTAWLRILAMGRYDRLVEVAKVPVEVSPVQP